jgi:hypothetical protein
MTVHPKMKLHPVVVHKPTTYYTVLNINLTAASTPVNVGVSCAFLQPLPLCRTVHHILLLCFPLFFLSSILQQLLPLCTGFES